MRPAGAGEGSKLPVGSSVVFVVVVVAVVAVVVVDVVAVVVVLFFSHSRRHRHILLLYAFFLPRLKLKGITFRFFLSFSVCVFSPICA